MASSQLLEIQSRTAFDSFYPMELVPTKEEKDNFLIKHNKDYLIFAENRLYPIRMLDDIPLKWIEKDLGSAFSGKAMRGEYYCFQIGVYAARSDLKSIRISYSDLTQPSGEIIKSSQITCFNSTGVDPYGKDFTKNIDVSLGKVQPLWIGIDIPENQKSGKYTGSVTLKPEGLPEESLTINIDLADSLIADRGDNETWRHSRLRWLNSKLGIDDNNVSPYSPIRELSKNHFQILGRDVILTENGLPSGINAWGTEILSSAMKFIIESDQGIEEFSNFRILESDNKTGIATRTITADNNDFYLTVESSIESDGYLDYKYHIKAKKDLDVSDIRLEISYKADIAEYMMGMGEPGRLVPDSINMKWNGPYDSYWVGNRYGGLYCELRGASYCGPLLNLYHPQPPSSWDNGGNGGVKVKKSVKDVKSISYSGKRHLEKDQTIDFEFALIVTPVKELNPKNQFRDRYYHNGGKPNPDESEVAAGVKIINIHHANIYNPYLNYPFLATDKLRSIVDYWHSKGIKVKIYYTIRELTNHVTEIWALRSFGDEILASGNGGGFTWLREHLLDNYTPQWYQHFDNDSLGIDAALLTSTGDSRWFNYYIEGLAWLVRNVDIDGIYLDDVSFDRRIIKRMRKVMEMIKPGCIIDLHSNTGFSKGPATQYTEYFPYIDKLWFGESFQYDKMPPENWFVEVSGIPFGLMGDMLQGGGNPWRGMVYGMTVRYPWTTDGVRCDPRSIWTIWDSFGIENSRMVGYWDKKPLVTTSDPDVFATAYVKDGKTLISLASWASENKNVRLHIDWDGIGLERSKSIMFAPKIDKFQPERSFSADEEIMVEPAKGWLIIISNLY
jgi:hypothetical protein